MFGYDFSFDLNSDNSNAIIAERIEPGKTVLEFGPAYGRLTRFLKEKKGCTVDIVEMNEESGRSAAQYARNACIGLELGNIENDVWCQKLEANEYDYIVFADVLEHLRKPEDALTRCYHLLKPNGAILCSIPNIAHASIIISLLNNDFPYHSTGLLDRTHISFFTNKTFREMCQRCHYNVVYEHAIRSQVGTNEIPYSYENAPDTIENLLRFTKNSEAYQYVFELRREDTIEDVPIQVDSVAQLGWKVKCFVKECEDIEFTPERQICKKITGKDVDVTFDLREYKKVSALQINLIDCNAIIKLEGVFLGDADGSQKACTDFDMNGERYGTQVWNVSTESPQIFLQVKPTTSYVRLIYNIIVWNGEMVFDVSKAFSGIYTTWKEKEKELIQENQELQQQRQLDFQEAKKQNEDFKRKCDELEQMQDELSQQNEKLRQLNQELADNIALLRKQEESRQEKKWTFPFKRK